MARAARGRLSRWRAGAQRFSYHLPGASMMETGAQALGCTVFPAGTGQTEQQVQAMAELRPDGYLGTPSFLRILVEKAQEAGADVPSLPRHWSAARPSRRCATGWRARHPGLPELRHGRLGLIAYETAAREGLVLDEGVIVEIVRPGTGDPVAEGEVGEVVVTTLNPDYPLIRFGTGDLSAVLPGPAPRAAPTPASRAGWAAPTRPPRCAACSCTPARWPRCSSAFPRWRGRAWWSAARWPTTR
jgi:phenylacetate-CoA ligase